MAQIGPVLALDVGERRIGLALSDSEGIFAFPHGTIERTNLRADVDAIAALANDHGARTLVVGDPLTLSGERGLAAQRIDAFVARLTRVVTVPIVRVDERLTTAAAQRSLIAADVSRARRKKVVDKLAATLILESYLARARS